MPITLKAARVNAGLTQKEASQLIGISESSLLSYEKARTLPSQIDVINKIEKAYGIGYNDIIFLPKNNG